MLRAWGGIEEQYRLPRSGGHVYDMTQQSRTYYFYLPTSFWTFLNSQKLPRRRTTYWGGAATQPQYEQSHDVKEGIRRIHFDSTFEFF